MEDSDVQHTNVEKEEAKWWITNGDERQAHVRSERRFTIYTVLALKFVYGLSMVTASLLSVSGR
jgi:hypothetical protein